MKRIVVSLAVAVAAVGAQGAEKVTYADHVLPIFRNTCLNCHNPDKKKAGLDLSTYQGSLQGSENGKVLMSGNPAGSLLFKCVKQTEDPKMPPKGDKLSDADLALIEKWIAGQLLETASGSVVAAANNNVQVAAVSLTKPDGPPPMPGELPLEPVVRTRTANAITALAVSPWAPIVAIGGQRQIVLYQTETLEPLGILPFPEGFPAIIRFSRNGQLLLTGGGLGGKSGQVALWDIKTGDRIATLGAEFDQVLAADVSADQQFVAMGGPNRLVKIYSTKDGKLVTSIKKHTDWVTAIAYSPDGKYLASADRNGGIQVWEGSTGKEFNVLAGHKAMVTALSFMPGVLASSSEDGKIALWDVKEGKEIKSWNAHAGGVAWVDFTPDGRLTSCGRDKVAKVWDQTGKTLGTTAAFADITLRAALSNDRVIAGDWTGQIRVCALDGKPIGELTSNPPTLADRLASAQKRIAESQAGLPKLQQQLAALDEKRKSDAAAIETARVLVAQLEKRVADESGQLEEFRKQRDASDDAGRAAAQQKMDAQKNQIAASQTELDKAKADLQVRLASVSGAQPAPVAAAPAPEIDKKIEQQTAELAKLREARASNKEGTPEWAEADKKVQEKKAEIAQMKAAGGAVAKAPEAPAPAAAKISPDDEAYAKTKAAFDQANAELATARTEFDRWSLAQLFQTVHNAKQSLGDKQAQYQGYVNAAKDALLPVEQARTELAAAEKTITESPAKLAEKTAASENAQRTLDPIAKALEAAEAAVAEHEKALKAAMENGTPGGSKVAELAKKLEQQTAEVAALREVRLGKAEGTPDYAEADAKVQAKKAEIAQTEAALTAAKSGSPGSEGPDNKAAQGVLALLAKAKEAREQSRAEIKTATEKAAAAARELSQAKNEAEQAQKRGAELKAKLPEIAKNAEAAKAEAERAVAAAEKDLVIVKAQVEKLRADYEKVKAAGAKPAAPGLVQAKL